MSELLRKYLLSSVAFMSRGGDDGAGDPADDDAQGDPPEEEEYEEGVGDDAPPEDALPEDPPQGDNPDDQQGELRTQDDPAPRGGRARERIQRLSEENRAQKQRLDDMERRLNERQAPAQQQTPQMSPQEEQALLATMTVEERMDYKQNKFLQSFQQQQNHTLFGVRDQTDRATFATEIASKPHLKRFESEVEQRYARLIREGQYAPRKAVLTYLLGEKALAADTGRQRTAAQDRVRRQSTRPANGRGDAQGQQRRGGKSLEDRLADVPL